MCQVAHGGGCIQGLIELAERSVEATLSLHHLPVLRRES